MRSFKEITTFFSAFKTEVREGCRQMLEYFGCCEDILEHLNKLHIQELTFDRRQAEQLAEERKKRREERKEARKIQQDQLDQLELPPLQAVVGLCPQCGSELRGEPYRTCKEIKTKQFAFYKECSGCEYWSEMFLEEDKYTEIAGQSYGRGD